MRRANACTATQSSLTARSTDELQTSSVQLALARGGIGGCLSAAFPGGGGLCDWPGRAGGRVVPRRG